VASDAIPAAGTRRRRSALAREEMRDGYLMMLPWVVGFVVLVAGPMLYSLYMSFTNWQMLVPEVWTGLANYREMAGDELVRTSLGNTAYYTLLAVPLYTVLGLGVGLVMASKIAGVRFYRTAYFLPSVTPIVATALLWMLIFQPDFGFANWALGQIGVPRQLWLLSPAQSKPVLVFMHLWGVGGSMPIFLGGLRGIPPELYEAAKIDGAGRWSSFRNVTLPLLSPVIFFVVITGFIGGFQVFTSAYVATAGGPANSTRFFVLHLYDTAFSYFRMGYASAMAWLLFLVVLLFTLVQFRVARRLVYYEDAR
jgi:multiple sugar transport system permease protein